MAQSTTQLLFPQTSYTTESLVRGIKRPAAAYYLGSADLQTLTWNITSLTATIVIQASLVSDPVESTDNDWFPIYTTIYNNATEISYSNITGNFVWIRAKIQGWSQGTINNIKVTY